MSIRQVNNLTEIVNMKNALEQRRAEILVLLYNHVMEKHNAPKVKLSK